MRLHNVIRKAGDVINSVPDEAVIETKVRAASLGKLEEITDMVNRAYDGAAYAFGGRIEKRKCFRGICRSFTANSRCSTYGSSGRI